jgi:hypothetical protein
MRRAIGIAPAPAGRDELELNDLLGEGTFGKVRIRGWAREHLMREEMVDGVGSRAVLPV